MAMMGYPEAMPIQEKCWDIIVAGKDCEAIAEPGSGKTLAFLLPTAYLVFKNKSIKSLDVKLFNLNKIVF